MSFYWRWVVVRAAVARCAIDFDGSLTYALISCIGVARLTPKPWSTS
jgi:hypothetical protein